MLFTLKSIDYKFRYCLFTVLCVFLTNIISTRAASSARVKYEGHDVVLEGNPFTITCQISVFDTVKWQKDGHNIAFDTIPGDGHIFRDSYNNYSMSREEADGKVLVQLSVPYARPYHTGNYRCNTFHNNSHHLLVLSGVSLKPNYDFDKYRVMEYRQLKVVLSCGNSTDLKLEWYKGNDPIKDSEKYKLEGQSLSIDRPADEDAGTYRCVDASSNSSESIELISRPFARLPENTIVVEGETLTLDCQVTGIPTPTIVWKIGENVYNASRDNVEILASKEGVVNGVLQIKEVTMQDRNYYSCIASNIANFDNNTLAKPATSLVRVKDKLAALWPFLGICAEVFVLCAIILIYEKKRNKAELEESDTDNSPEQKNTPDHGKDSVRHRK